MAGSNDNSLWIRLTPEVSGHLLYTEYDRNVKAVEKHLFRSLGIKDEWYEVCMDRVHDAKVLLNKFIHADTIAQYGDSYMFLRRRLPKVLAKYIVQFHAHGLK